MRKQRKQKFTLRISLCLQCCKAIIQSGITAVYYAQDYKNHPYAIELFEQANVTVKHVPLEYDIAALEDQKRYTELKELFVSLEKIIYQWKNYSMYSRKQK